MQWNKTDFRELSSIWLHFNFITTLPIGFALCVFVKRKLFFKIQYYKKYILENSKRCIDGKVEETNK